MTDPNRNSPNSRRQPYQKPVLVQIKLVVEEAIFAACKTGTVTGPGGPGCTKPNGNGACQGQGGS